MNLKIIKLFQKFKFQKISLFNPSTLFSLAWRDPWDHFLFCFYFLEIIFDSLWSDRKKIGEVFFL